MAYPTIVYRFVLQRHRSLIERLIRTNKLWITNSKTAEEVRIDFPDRCRIYTEAALIEQELKRALRLYSADPVDASLLRLARTDDVAAQLKLERFEASGEVRA